MTAPSQVEALVERLRKPWPAFAQGTVEYRQAVIQIQADRKQAADMLSALSTPAPEPDEARAREVLAETLDRTTCFTTADNQWVERKTAVRAMLAFARECAAQPGWRTIDSAEGGA